MENSGEGDEKIIDDSGASGVDAIPNVSPEQTELLKQWGLFVTGSSSEAKVNDGASEEGELEAIRTNIRKYVSGEKALIALATTLSNHTWYVYNGNFICDGQDMGCPLSLKFLQGQPEFLIPLMSSTGGFNAYHAHILPALMINQMMKRISNFQGNKVNTYVLCHGNGIGPEDAWWRQPIERVEIDSVKKKIVDLIIKSNAFKSILGFMIRRSPGEKSINRLCIWIGMPGHVFTLVWEVSYEETETGFPSSICFVLDNIARNDFSKHVVKEFVWKLNGSLLASGISTKTVENGYSISRGEIQMSASMMCVSYMTRATLYFSMINGTYNSGLMQAFHSAVGIDKEYSAYISFSRSLAAFIEQSSEENKMVWVSPINAAFINIQDIYLMQIDPADAHIKSTNRYVYQGIDNGFMKSSVVCNDGCVLSSEISISALDIIRECQTILENHVKLIK